MFIYSVRATTVKFVGVIVLSLAALIALIVFIPTEDNTVSAFTVGSEISYDNVKTNDDRRAFLSQFGWETSEEPIKEKTVTIPEEFNRVFTGYNEMQKKQGLDLSSYKRKEVQSYTYEVTNYDGHEGKVLANILVYRGKVIAGDICSAEADGFVHGLEKE